MAKPLGSACGSLIGAVLISLIYFLVGINGWPESLLQLICGGLLVAGVVLVYAYYWIAGALYRGRSLK